MGREEGGGFRMGNTGIPVVDSFRYLAKLIQYCKVKKKKVILMLPTSLNPSVASCWLQVQTLLWPMKLFIIWARLTFLIIETVHNLLKPPCPLTPTCFVDAVSSAYNNLSIHSFSE